MGAFSGTALKRVLSRAQMRLADRSDACEGPGWARTEHMQKGRAATSSAFRRWLLAPKRSSKTLAAGRPHCRTRASCWKRLERENLHASVGLADVLERGLLGSWIA